MSPTKLFTLSLACLIAGGAAQCSEGCIDTLTDVQVCLRECVNKNPVAEWGGAVDFATNGASRLWQCLPGNGKLPEFTNPDPLVDLMGCCEMSAACNATMMDARTCSKNSCMPSCIKTEAQSYMNCIVSKSKANVCRFAGLCVGQFTGNDAFDFADVLADAADQVTATDCSPMDAFVDSACDISNRCCDDCNTDMSSLVSCLVNDFLLPLSSSGGAVECQISSPVGGTCAVTGASAVAVGRGAGRQMENQTDEIALEGADISECEDVLTFSFMVHNESYAVDQFVSCIGKKVGHIIAESETNNDTTPSNEEVSSAVTVYGSALLIVSTMLTALTL